MTDISQFANKSDLFKYLKDNKENLISEKKGIIKHADAVIYHTVDNKSNKVIKADSNINIEDTSKISAKLVLNTTNLLDSHGDVHVKGIWDKTLQEQRNLMLFQEHKSNSFSHVITSDVIASVKDFTWLELNEPYSGTTQALIFDVVIPKDRNPYMFEQYIKGYVTNHSVGMRYVKILMAINSEEKYYAEEKEIWDNYIGQVANVEKANENGYFWVVKEAKLIEGSAVPIGSNTATPTLNVESKNEPLQDTQQDDSREDTIKQINEYIENKFNNLKKK